MQKTCQACNSVCECSEDYVTLSILHYGHVMCITCADALHRLNMNLKNSEVENIGSPFLRKEYTIDIEGHALSISGELLLVFHQLTSMIGGPTTSYTRSKTDKFNDDLSSILNYSKTMRDDKKFIKRNMKKEFDDKEENRRVYLSDYINPNVI